MVLILMVAALILVLCRRRSAPGHPAESQPGPLVVSPPKTGSSAGSVEDPPEVGRESAATPVPASAHFVRGVVLGPDGLPRPGTFLLAAFRPFPEPEVWTNRELSVTSDPTGAFAIPCPGDGTMQIRLGHVGFYDPGIEVVASADRDTAGVEFRLSQDWPIEVNVVDESGIAISKCLVTAMAGRGGEQSWTDGQGKCVLHIFDGDSATIRVDLPLESEVPAINPPLITVEAGTRLLRIVAPRGAIARGVCLDVLGRPARTGISASSEGRNLSFVRSGEDGRFEARVSATELTRLFAMEFDANGSLDNVRAGDEGLVLRLVADPSDRRLALVVKGPDGVLAGVTLKASNGRGNEVDLVTDARGMCSLQGFARGPIHVDMYLPGSGSNPLWLNPSGVDVAADVESVELSAVEGFVFRGQLRAPQGFRIRSYRVDVSAGGNLIGSTSGLGAEFQVVLPRTAPSLVSVTVAAYTVARTLSGLADRVDPRAQCEVDLKPQ